MAPPHAVRAQVDLPVLVDAAVDDVVVGQVGARLVGVAAGAAADAELRGVGLWFRDSLADVVCWKRGVGGGGGGESSDCFSRPSQIFGGTAELGKGRGCLSDARAPLPKPTSYRITVSLPASLPPSFSFPKPQTKKKGGKLEERKLTTPPANVNNRLNPSSPAITIPERNVKNPAASPAAAITRIHSPRKTL